MALLVYTACDKKAEAECQSRLFEFKEELTKFFSAIKDFMDKCGQSVEELWVLASKYATVDNSCPDVHFYPLQMTVEVKAELNLAINKKYQEIRQQLTDMIRAQRVLQSKFDGVEVISMKLNFDFDTPLINGSARQLGLDYYLDKGSDLMFEYQTYLNQIKVHVKGLDLRNTYDIDALKKVIPMKDNVNYLTASFLKYCKCIKPTYTK